MARLLETAVQAAEVSIPIKAVVWVAAPEFYLIAVGQGVKDRVLTMQDELEPINTVDG